MGRLTDIERFRELFAKGGMEVTDEQYQKLSRYAEMLCEWNEKMNLTAITDPEGIAEKHFYDSVYPFTLTDMDIGSLIDVGTGAGFPSVPLGIFRPGIKLTLLDSLNKRVGFLKAVTGELSLDAECVHGRAEETARFIKGGNPMRESFDAATARAVANLSDLCEYCLPFVKVGGVFLAMKGHAEEEIKDANKAIALLGGTIEKTDTFRLPGTDMERSFVVIRKENRTPSRYPRKAGTPSKEPL